MLGAGRSKQEGYPFPSGGPFCPVVRGRGYSPLPAEGYPLVPTGTVCKTACVDAAMAVAWTLEYDLNEMPRLATIASKLALCVWFPEQRPLVS